MAGIRADIDLSVNTQGVKRSLDKATNEINKVVNKISGKNIGFSVNEKSFTQPLGRINASANEFTKSLEASNARVIAFGASVAILDGISNSFKGLVREAVKFEKTLADINVVLNLSNAQLRQFGEGLFDTARKTAQGFNMASEAALEFSRQGLSTEEVLRRTNDALILTRLTSLKAADAVAGLTAAVNAFGDAGLTTTDIIDKLAAVDVKFAVSSEDLINALQRAGAVAIDAGVEFDSLIGLVAALQQTTARGGAVIGNSLKTIFTRIQRPESLRQLEEMGIAIRDISGAVLPADRILLNISKTFDKLTQAQQSNVVQFSAGIFQANVFRAALRDLAKEQSLQVQATQVAANAAGEAAQKNELLNKTVSALASQAGTNIQELGAILGQLALGPQLADALEFVNKRIEEIRGALGGGEDEGSTFAKGLVKGIGNVISGPAAIAFGAIFIKLFVNIAKFASNSMKDVLGVVSQKDKIKQMEESIVEALSRNQHIQQSLNNLGDDRLAQEKFLLGIIEQQTAAIREQRGLAAALAGPLVQKGVSPNITSAGGLIPEGSKKAERQGATRGGYTAGAIDSMNIAGLGDVVYNKAETVKQFPGMKQPAIMPPQDSKAGSVYQQAFQEKHGFNPYANGGFIPNFATLVGKKLVMDKAKLSLFGGSMDIARATGANYKEIEKLFASGQPLKMSASLKDIIMSSDGGKKKISGKETLFEAFSALSGAGVHSIERMFNVRPPVPGRRGQGKLTQDQFAERKSLNLLNKELGGHQLTYDPKTKKGVQNYPVDIIGPGAHEVKSGKLSAANLISKSLRMASDRELSGWMAANKISGGKGLQGKNLKEAQRLAGKLGIKGSGQAGALTEADADIWSMSEGLVPNFVSGRKKDWKGLYKKFIKKYEKGDIKSIQDMYKAFESSRGSFRNYITEYTQIRDGKERKSSQLRNAIGDEKFNGLKKIYNELKDGTSHLSSVRIKGDLFEEVFSMLAGQPFKKGTDALDFSEAQGRRIRVPRELRKKIGLQDSIIYGDTESGTGHGAKLMRTKVLRELAEQGKLGQVLSQSGKVELPGSRFVDIVAQGTDARPKKNLTDTLNNIRSKSKPLTQQAIDQSIKNKRDLNKKISYDYHVDDIDLNKLTFQDINKYLSKQDADSIMRKTARFSDVQSKFNSQGLIPNFGYMPLRQTKNGKNYVWERDLNIAKRQYPRAEFKQWDKNPKMYFVSGDMSRGPTQEEIDKDILKFSDERRIKEFGRFAASKGYPQVYAAWQKGITTEKVVSGYGRNYDRVAGKTKQVLPKQLSIKKLQKISIGDMSDIMLQDLYGSESFDNVGKNYSSDLVKKPSGKRMVRLGLEEREFGTYKRGDLLPDTAYNPIAENTVRQLYSEFKSKYGASEGLIPNFANIVPFKKKTIQSKNLMHQEYLKAYAEGENKFKPGQTMLQFLSQFYDRKTLQDLRKYPEDYRILSGGFVPNFANPLRDAIEREKAAGIPASNIRVEQSNQLKGPGNPMGLAVTNTRDEPAGVGQGIRRAKSMGLDPKSHGASRGFMPNFVSGAGIQSTNFDSLNKATKERIETEKKATQITRRRADADVMGLQKLFFLQSGISMANGMLQELGDEAGSTMKKFSELSMGATSVLSTFIAMKEFSAMLSGPGGVGLRQLGGKGSQAGGRAIKRGSQRALSSLFGGNFRMFGKGIGLVTKGLLRFTPVVGQLITGATALHEVLKAFDINVFDLFKDNADRAADKLEKLSESAEKTQSALDEANNLSATRDKMSKLEILGSQRTLKQEKELISLKIKEIKQQTSLQSKIAKVDTAHLKNKDLINEVNKVKSGEIKGTEALVRVLEKIAKQEAVQAAFATAIKDFSKKTEDEFGMFKSDTPSDLLKKQITQLANNIAEVTIGLAPERKQAMKESLAAGNIQAISGLESLDLETAEKKQFFINALQRQIEVSEREFEDDKKIQQAKAGALNEYVKIVANYKKQTEQIAHQNNLDNIISASKRKINSSLIDLQGEYQMISRSTAIQNKTALEAAAITEKLESDKLKANNEALNGLETLRKQYMNIGKIASRFNSDAKDAQAGVAEFKQAITTGLNPQRIAEIGDILGNQTPQQVQEINSFFAELGEEIKDLNDNQEIVNKLTKKYGDIQDATLRQAIMLLTHKMELTNIEQEHIELVKKINDTLRRSNETSEATAKAARAGLENEKALNLIKQKTIEGARELAKIFAEQVNPAESMIKNLQGEVDTLAVINDFRKNSLQKIIDSGVLDQKAYETQLEKNRTDAEAALLSLKQLQVQENILRDTDEFKTIQIAKMQSEILGASAAAKDAAFRNEYLSYNQTRESLVQSQINEETNTLETTARNNLTKLKLLAGSEELKKQVDLQIQEEITSAQSSALINSEKALILSAMGEQGRLLQQANELQESSNKLTELQNAIRKAAVSKEELRLSVGTDLATERAGAIRGTREAGMRATMTGSPEDALAFAQSLKETNKLLGEGSRAFDTLRVKIAEMDVAAKNLGSDLVDIGLDQTRSGMKQLFKDIGSGAKSAKEAWSDFGLGLADVLLDRMMEHNIDQIIKNLTFAFTGENALSEAEKIAGSNNHLIDANNKLIASLDALARQVEGQQRALAEAVAGRADIAGQAGVAPGIDFGDVDSKRGAQINKQAAEQFAVAQAKRSADRIAEQVKAAKERQLAEDANKMPAISSVAQKGGRAQNKELYPITVQELVEQDLVNKRHEELILLARDAQKKSNLNKGFLAQFGEGQPGEGVKKAHQRRYAAQRDLGATNRYIENLKVAIGENEASQKTPEQIKQSRDIMTRRLKDAVNEVSKLEEEIKEANRVLEIFQQSLDGAANIRSELSILEGNIKTINNELGNRVTMPIINTDSTVKTSDNFFGGKIQKFAKGGFVEGEPGVDKVPAMLTAGEFVVPKRAAKALKDGGMLQYFEEGGVADRVKAAGTGLAQTFVMQEVARYVAGKMQEKKLDKPPEFDMNKFKNLNLNSTVSIARGDPRSSGKLLGKDPIMEEYRQHLLDVASYRAAQKNKKVSERMSRIGSIVGTVASFAVSQLTELAKKPLNAIIEKGKNVALGYSGLGDHSEAFKAARKQGLDVNYSDVQNSIESGNPLSINKSSWMNVPTPGGGERWEKLVNQNETSSGIDLRTKSIFEKRGSGFDRKSRLQEILNNNTGGEIPSMLTAGESFIPAPIAKRIGYDNLNKMNRTGSLPIIQGPGGIDNVGPVGLSEGDFIIRRSSTDKLLRENPNMMRFAMQNPDGFRKAEQGYYQGGIVGTSSSPSSPVSAPQKTSGAKPAPVVENRISSLLEGTQANQKETVATNQNTEVTNNINVNVTIDKSGNEKVSTEGAQGTYEQEQQLAMKIKTKVLEVIREEKRIGGELSG